MHPARLRPTRDSEAGVRQALVIAGDVDHPAGPFFGANRGYRERSLAIPVVSLTSGFQDIPWSPQA